MGATLANAAILSTSSNLLIQLPGMGGFACVLELSAQAIVAVVSLKCDAQKRQEQSTAAASSDGSTDVVFENLTADGSECLLQISNGGVIAADDRATVRLPIKNRVHIPHQRRHPTGIAYCIDGYRRQIDRSIADD